MKYLYYTCKVNALQKKIVHQIDMKYKQFCLRDRSLHSKVRYPSCCHIVYSHVRENQLIPTSVFQV